MPHTPVIEGEAAAKSSIFQLLLLGTIKLIAGIFSGMTVLIADAINTFADTLGIFAAYIGLRLSRRRADEKFEYGYYKIETFAAFVISVWVIGLSFYIFSQSIDTFFQPTPSENLLFAIFATIFAITQSFYLQKKLTLAGQQSNSLALQTSANDKKLDILTGCVVLISIAANYLHLPYVEGTVSGLLAILIFKEGFSSAKESLFFLLDYWNDPKLKRQIKKILIAEKDIIKKIRRLRLRRAGTFIFGECYIEINPFAEMKDLREELEILQAKITSLNPYIKDFSIYSHIPASNKIRVAIPLKKGRTLKGLVAANIKETAGYLFVTLKNGKVLQQHYRALKATDHNIVALGNFLKKEKVQILIDNKLNSLLYYNLRRTHQILIYPNFSDIKTAEKTIELILIDS